MLRPTDNAVDGGQEHALNQPALAVHIHFYGRAEPIVLALPSARPGAARSYYERLKSEVIEAQRHNEPRVSIRPFDRRRALLKLDPKKIRRVDLVDGLKPSPEPVAIPPSAPATREPLVLVSTLAAPEFSERVRGDTEVASVGNGHVNQPDTATKRPEAGENLPAELQRRIAILLG